MEVKVVDEEKKEETDVSEQAENADSNLLNLDNENTSAIPSKVLLLRIFNQKYPITKRVIESIFEKFDFKALHIIVFGEKHKNVVVEFLNIEEAEKAKQCLDGQDIYYRCCTLSISFSQLQRLDGDKNDRLTLDYTLQGESPRVRPWDEGKVGTPRSRSNVKSETDTKHQTKETSTASSPRPSDGLLCSEPIFDTQVKKLDPKLQNEELVSKRQDQEPVHKGQDHEPDHNEQDCETVLSKQDREPFHNIQGRGPVLSRPDYRSVRYGHSTGPIHRPSHGSFGEGCVLLVHGLEPSRTTCESIFNIFCLYGNVKAVKFLNEKPDGALVEMETKNFAQQAKCAYHGMTMFGLQLYIKWSLHPFLPIFDERSYNENRRMWRRPQQSFVHSISNRWIGKTSRRPPAHPSSVLHFYNAPVHIDQPVFNGICKKLKVDPPEKFFMLKSKNEKRRCGLVQFIDNTKALEFLTVANNYKFPPPPGSGEGRPIMMRLCYSRVTEISLLMKGN